MITNNNTIHIAKNYVTTSGQGKVIIESEKHHTPTKVYIETSELDMIYLSPDEASKLAKTLLEAIEEYNKLTGNR